MIKLCMLLTALCAANLGFSKDKANYSAAATAGDFIYVSGQYPVDLRTGVMVDGDIETLTDQVIDFLLLQSCPEKMRLSQPGKTESQLRLKDNDDSNDRYGK